MPAPTMPTRSSCSTIFFLFRPLLTMTVGWWGIQHEKSHGLFFAGCPVSFGLISFCLPHGAKRLQPRVLVITMELRY